jgi:hypothetical protein
MSAVDASHTLPTLREELDRKVYETLEWLIVGHEKGRLTKEQVSMGMDVLFMAVSGLVDGDFIHIITEAQNEFQTNKSVVKRHFHAPEANATMTFSWVVGESNVVVTVVTKREFDLETETGVVIKRSVVRDCDNAAKARAYLEERSNELLKNGWIEL